MKLHQKKGNGLYVLCLVIAFIFPILNHAQLITSIDDLDSATKRASRLYASAIGSSARLYYGIEYRATNIRPQDEGHPYLIGIDFESGTIYYEGQYFVKANLLYDLVLDKIVVENKQGFALELIKDQVSYFTIAERTFVNVVTSNSTTIRPGFYEILYNGSIKAYAKRFKEVLIKIENGMEKKTYKDKSKYFILKNGIFIPVYSKKSVLEVFADKQEKLKGNLTGINFKSDRGRAIQLLSMLYDGERSVQ